MGIKVLTLAKVSLEGGFVEIHETGRKAKVTAHHIPGNIQYALTYVDDPEKKEHPIHFDQMFQGFVTDDNKEIDESQMS